MTKKWLLAVVALVVVSATVLALAIVLSGNDRPYNTLPRPSLQNTPLKAPPASCPHVMGGCLPQPTQPTPPTQTAPPLQQTTPKPNSSTQFASLRFVSTSGTISGPDLSNNDPIYPAGAWGAIAAHSRFAYLKSVEGTGYYDSTAAAMAATAKAHGVLIGGYDFQHVCQNSASAEAAFFVRALRAQGLLGAGTLPPAADTEYGSGSCGGRVWLQTWVDTVYNLDGHVCPIDYTGAWWWQPNIGAYWPTCENKQLLSWISGYNVLYPYMPSGVTHLDIWQFSDHGYNGYNYTDLSAWEHDTASFVVFAGRGVAQPDPYRIYPKHQFTLRHGVRASEYWTVKTWDDRGCANPVRRVVCRATHLHLRYLRDREYYLAYRYCCLGPFNLPPDWGYPNKTQPLGLRFAGISRRLR